MSQLILILNYHQIVEDNTTEENVRLSPFVVKRSDLSSQLKIIRDRSIPVISFLDWKTGKVSSPLSIILTFDDGFSSDYEIVFKLLTQEKIPGAFFPILSEINRENHVTWTQLKEMAASEFTIGSHCINHKNLLELSEKECRIELIESKRELEQNLCQTVDIVSLPFGMYNNSILQIAKEVGYSNVLSTRVKKNCSNRSLLLHRVNVKSTISLKEFEKIISMKSNYLIKRRLISNISFFANKFFGTTPPKSNSTKE